MAVLFSAVMASRRAYQTESEDGAFEGLLLAPIDKAAVFLGKAFAVPVELLALVIAVLLLVIVLFDLSVANPFLDLAAFVLARSGSPRWGACSASWPSPPARARPSSPCWCSRSSPRS